MNERVGRSSPAEESDFMVLAAEPFRNGVAKNVSDKRKESQEQQEFDDHLCSQVEMLLNQNRMVSTGKHREESKIWKQKMKKAKPKQELFL